MSNTISFTTSVDLDDLWPYDGESVSRIIDNELRAEFLRAVKKIVKDLVAAKNKELTAQVKAQLDGVVKNVSIGK